MIKLFKFQKIEKVVYLVLTLFIFLGMPRIVAGNTFFYMTIQAPTSVSSPSITLQNVNNSLIYTNNTSAKVTVQDGTNSLNVLKIHNETSGNWKLQLIAYSDNNVSRLTNCTIWLHDGNASVQIKILNGTYNKTSGDFYDFAIGSNNYITITVSTNTTGTSYICTYLKILKPETSTYFLYIVTFIIT